MTRTRAHYAYDRSTELAKPQPYAFAPFSGRAGLAAWNASRRRLGHLLRVAEDSPSCGPADEAPMRWRRCIERRLSNGAGVEVVVPDRDDTDREECSGGPDTPTVDRALESAHGQWEGTIGIRSSFETGEMLASILIPCLDGGDPLVGDGYDREWACRGIERLLGRFQAHGKIFPLYDAHWRRVKSPWDSPSHHCWLAVGAAWLALGRHDRGETAESLSTLNGLLKIHDLITARLSERRWNLTPFEAHLVGLSMRVEGWLVDRVAQRAGVTT